MKEKFLALFLVYTSHITRYILCVSEMKNLELNGISSYQFFIFLIFFFFSCYSDLSLGSFRKGKDKIHHGSHNNLHDVTTTTNPFHFYTNPKWYESYFDPIIPRNVSFFCSITIDDDNWAKRKRKSFFT